MNEIKLVVVQDNNNIVKEFKGDDAISQAIGYLSGLIVDKPLVEKMLDDVSDEELTPPVFVDDTILEII